MLKNFDVDYELLTAGEYKRTLTMLGENTERAVEVYSDLEQTHDLFKDFVSQYRPSLIFQPLQLAKHGMAKRLLKINWLMA